MINHIISKCSNLAQREYKTRHKWVGKMICWELCKKFRFDHTKKMIYAQPRIRAGKWNTQTFATQTDHQISTRRLDLVIVSKKKRTCRIVNFAVRLFKGLNWKKAKSEKSTESLLENWKNYGTWKWRWNLLQLVRMVQSLKVWYMDWTT